MPVKSKRRSICEDYCKIYPKYRDLQLAKKVYCENKSEFKDVEQVRSMVRAIRGHVGEHMRKYTANKDMYTPVTYDTRAPRNFKEEVNTSAKVLIIDIETAPINAYVWGIWQQNIALNQISSDWFCLTWAAKWLFEDKVYSGKLTKKEAIKQDDSRIIKGVWELINQADIVIAHNAVKFDIPKLNSRFIINGLHPPLPYQVIDTLVHIRRQFGFTSNKLEYVQKLLNLHRKTDTGGMGLWIKCMAGDEQALTDMETYNVNDVRILEETYLHIRAWIKPHPNMGLFILDETQSRCPSCGHHDLRSEGKAYYTSVNAYEVYRCNNCGSTGRKRTTTLDIKQRRNLLSPSAR
jgi:DNA-directed RNA polymerase subunit RPC12/RpoP